MIDTQVLINEGIDYEGALSRLNYNVRFYEEALLAFDKGEHGEDFIIAMKSGNVLAAKEHAFYIEGESLGVGMMELYSSMSFFCIAVEEKVSKEELQLVYDNARSSYIKMRALVDCIRHGMYQK